MINPYFIMRFSLLLLVVLLPPARQRPSSEAAEPGPTDKIMFCMERGFFFEKVGAALLVNDTRSSRFDGQQTRTLGVSCHSNHCNVRFNSR
jgi:hypothetical protein